MSALSRAESFEVVNMENNQERLDGPVTVEPSPPAVCSNCSCSKQEASPQPTTEKAQEKEVKDDNTEKADGFGATMPIIVDQGLPYGPTEDEGIRRGRFRRRRYEDSVYSLPSRSPSRERPYSRSLDKAESHEELIPASNSEVPAPTNRSMWLVPFGRSVYVTTHPATPVDFQRWLPVLAVATAEQWYSISSLDLATGHNFPLVALVDDVKYRQLQTVLRPKNDTLRAKGLSVPMIAATAALRTKNMDKSLENLVYFAVQESVVAKYDSYNNRRGYGDEGTGQAPGTALYRVVQSGSREGAAARAFYDAGLSGWSTVFVCAVYGERFTGFKPLLAQPKSYERAKSLEQLLEKSKEQKLSVFY